MGRESKNSSLASFVFEEALSSIPNEADFKNNLWKVFAFVCLIVLSFVIWIISFSFSILFFLLRAFSLILTFGGAWDFLSDNKERNH